MNRIAITNERGEMLQLDDQQNLVTEQAVAWLTDDELPAEISYPIDVPLTDYNKRFVSHGYRVDAALPRGVIPVSVTLEGVLYRRCQFAYKLQGGKLNGYLKIDSAEVYDKLRKLSLLEALPDVIRLGTGIVDAVAGVTPLLATRMQEIAELPPSQFPLTFFPVRNQGFWDTELATKLTGFTDTGFVNYWHLRPAGGHGFHQDRGFTLTELGYPVVPFFYLSWVMTRIMALAGYSIDSSWLASDEVRRLVIVNMTAINQALTMEQKAQGHLVTAGMHLPDLSVSDFLKAIKGRFGLIFGFNANTRTCFIERFVDVIQSGAAIDLTPYQIDAYDTGSVNGVGFGVQEFVDDLDELNKNPKGDTVKPDPYVMGLGETAIALRVGTCQMIYDNDPLQGGGRWMMPTVRQPGNTLDADYKASERYLDEKGKRRNDIGLKLLTYRGMSQDSSGAPYPFATNDDRDGRQIRVGTQALRMGGENGAWHQMLKAYYYFRDNTQTLSVPLLLPVPIVAKLSLLQPVWLSIEDQIRRSYLVQKMQAETPGMDGKAIVRLEVLTLPSGIDQPVEAFPPHFYVSLSVVDYPIRNIAGFVDIFLGISDYTISYWLDANKTKPANLQDRSVNLRKIRKGIPGAGNAAIRVDFHEESIVAYPASGNGGGLDPVLAGCLPGQYIGSEVVRYSLPNITQTAGSPVDGFTLTFQLDPGDDYTIL